MSKFNQLGLLEQANLIERAKELGDKKRLIKEGLKERLERPAGESNQSGIDKDYRQQNKTGPGSLADQVIKSSFAKKLENGEGYLCTCCSLKLADQLSASKHFNLSSEHKDRAEQFKRLIEQRVAEKKEQLRQKQQQILEQELQQQQASNQTQINPDRFMLVQEEEIIEENEDQLDDEEEDELARLEKLDRIQNQKLESKLNNSKGDEKLMQGPEEKKSSVKEKYPDGQNDSSEEDGHEEEYQERLIDDLDEVERLYSQIEQKKQQIIGKKRTKKVNLISLIESQAKDEGDDEFESLMLKKRKR